MIDDHPSLVFVVSIIVPLLIPPGHFLRPLLLLFGFGKFPLYYFLFLRHTPGSGSVAIAWAQRGFWGATVTKGSWFAILQSIAM